jgi:hypothetical protein
MNVILFYLAAMLAVTAFYAVMISILLWTKYCRYPTFKECWKNSGIGRMIVCMSIGFWGAQLVRLLL